jgi:hypothetical protein
MSKQIFYINSKASYILICGEKDLDIYISEYDAFLK